MSADIIKFVPRTQREVEEDPEPGFVWPCDCGKQLFWLTEDGPECFSCGQIARDWMESQ